MEDNFNNLKGLLDYIKSIGFFTRLFNWKKVKDMLIDAFSDFQKITIKTELMNGTIAELKSFNAGLKRDIDIAGNSNITLLNEIGNLKSSNREQANKINMLTGENSSRGTTIGNQKDKIISLEKEIESLKQKNDYLRLERDTLKEQNTQLLTEEDVRKQKFENDVASLNSIRAKIEADRQQEINTAHQKELQRIDSLKATWKNHQDTVKLTVKAICAKHTISYIDKVPFKGEPDNALFISDEYIVFDAKSPKTDDLNNFSNYLQTQADAAKKYAKQEDVKRWIFFVVPSNTYEILDKFVYNLADYDVFIVTLNSLEPIILSLKKIEEYDFAEQLSPEERENICRVLGKFAHLSKRRIQVDYYFIKQFIELSYNADSELPPDILEEVKKFEKEGKVNPPQDRRTKAITIGELDKEAIKIKNDASNQGILVKEETLSQQINKLPLYNDEINEEKENT